MRRKQNKGFTLAELLIVVAIIAVLVAVAVPVFSSQLVSARISTQKANLRSAYADAVAAALTERATESNVTLANGAVLSQWSDGRIHVHYSELLDTQGIPDDRILEVFDGLPLEVDANNNFVSDEKYDIAFSFFTDGTVYMDTP